MTIQKVVSLQYLLYQSKVIWYNIYTYFNCDIRVTYSVITSLMMSLGENDATDSIVSPAASTRLSLLHTSNVCTSHSLTGLQLPAGLGTVVRACAKWSSHGTMCDRAFTPLVQCSQPVPTPLETNLLFYEEGDDRGSEQLVICEGLAWDLMNLLMPHCFSRKMF